MRLIARLCLAGLALLASMALLTASHAQDIQPIINDFATAKSFKKVEAVIDRLAEAGDPAAAISLRALSDGRLKFRKSDGTVLITVEEDGVFGLQDPLTGEAVPTEGAVAKDFKKVKVKNSIRRKIAAVLSGMTLQAKDVAQRLAGAETIFATSDVTALPALKAAIEKETNESVKEAFLDAQASAILASDLGASEKLAAVERLEARGDRASLALLSKFLATSEGDLAARTKEAIEYIESFQSLWTNAQNIWYGISLGSVLLLAAIGLAITFGVMGVINMAHGEMVMLGAYTTFTVQQFLILYFPALLPFALLFALPLAFLVSGLVGLIMERGLISRLYGRPLETLLATWGVSLILQQTVRTIYGATNREVSNPSWMSGAFELGQLSITWNRLWIVLFALGVFAALYFIINRTSLGLDMRAVTQNRRMAGAMGIRTSWVDAMTFALGSGIAGIAGVALSQIGNVSPNLGQSYIIDSFLVVVFGGVGNLWGTLVGAMSLGILNKFLEPYAGAVLGKVLILVLIILFIQKRPRGLFALKGRAVEQ